MLSVELAAEPSEEVSALLPSVLPHAINTVAAIKVKMLARTLNNFFISDSSNFSASYSVKR
ncbi:hypothetical protein SDC9_127689 [bioreactor metagenome]|uniref:Uncharacterized protein n=1 Tax=bioreactor metagenome TaxID=1076179 RepID=A0A645CUS9_9ZZZZ